MTAEQRGASADVTREILSLLAADARRQARFFGYATGRRVPTGAPGARDAQEKP
ncbi:MAG TPA: hypothetical protein VJ698_10965 [Noviherbaspirillum sp.]|uniref:hypothetical protein n=1 Tax=Noviherbaspirillum sp. TaxID=1926288 RepID=UPI002B4A8239|nr:hypothetical protein [Noviherbaspirillum sp.]HJV85983.1 hypothetical protein [Noviherbaspirillum sp.]